MPRAAREAPGGVVFHVINRGVGGLRLFEKEADFEAFERVLCETLAVRPMRMCAYCVMPTHWHLVLWPRHDGDLAAFMQRLSITHVRRWQEYRRVVGRGHVYQGRYKSFPVQTDEHFLTVCRYVERNALRANLVKRAEDWRWSSLWRREQPDGRVCACLSEWPVERPRNWRWVVNQPEGEAELQALHRSIAKGQPFGNKDWISKTARRLGLENTLRTRGRPRKGVKQGG